MNKIIIASVLIITAVILLFFLYDEKSYSDGRLSVLAAGFAIGSAVVLLYFSRRRRKQ